MAAPNLTQRATVFVQKVGTDDAGANAVGAPQSRLTIAVALADLAANYPAASATFFHIVAVGPGTFVEAGLTLPPWTFIVGSCDGEDQPTTVILLSDDVALSAGWSVNATIRGGFGNLTFEAASGLPVIDLTLPAPVAGNPSRTVQIFNVQHALTDFVFEATSTADALTVKILTQNGVLTDTFRQIGGTSTIAGMATAAAVSIRDKNSFAAVGTWSGVVVGAGAALTASSVAAVGCTLRLSACAPRTVVFNQTAPGVLAVSADAVSLPIRANVSYTGTATAAANLTLLSDAAGEAYTPTTPANWLVVPATVQAALDALGASSGGSGTGTFSKIVRTGNLSSAAWGVTGVAIASIANTFTDTTSAGVVASAVAHSFGVPTFAASAVILYTNAANLYIAGDPVAGANVTISNAWGLWNVGKSRFDGNVSIQSATVSSSTTTGALIVAGGVGVVGAAFIGGALTVGGDVTGPTAAIMRITAQGTQAVHVGNNGTNSSQFIVQNNAITVLTLASNMATFDGAVRGNGGFIGSAGGVGLTQASTATLGRSITVENGLVTAFA